MWMPTGKGWWGELGAWDGHIYTIHTMSSPDSILKSRDVILPTKVRLVKAMAFPVVVYGCESWTIKKAERRRI